MDVIDWMLDSDPAIRWQVLRDLVDADGAEVAAQRARVAHEGLGARILASQDEDGAWHRDGAPAWLSTLNAMVLLRATGVDPEDPGVDAAITRLANGFRWHEQLGGKPFFEGETEACINGRVLAVGGSLGRPSDALARDLVDAQLPDGGWNCDAPPSQRSSLHSTICVLEGLLDHERAAGPSPAVTAARRRGEEYLLERGLFRRRSTGDVVDPAFLTLTFPARYHYDVLRGLDHLRAAGVAPDDRAGEAVRLVVERRQADGRWLLDARVPRARDRHDAQPPDFDLGETAGEPSRWMTLRALRVLRWYQRAWT